MGYLRGGPGSTRLALPERPAVAQAEPALPESLNDRESNNWSPLVSIADAIGPEWGELARVAAVTFAGKAATDSATIGALLLGDLRDLFHKRAEQEAHEVREAELSSAFVCQELGSMEARPWSEWGRSQKPITQRQLASMLEPFGVRPVGLRIGNSTPKGYRNKDCDDAFSRYLPEIPDPIRPSATTVGGVAENDDSASGTEADCCRSENGNPAYGKKDCGGSSDENAKNGQPAENVGASDDDRQGD